MKHAQKQSQGGMELVDLEMHCLSCGTRLYAPVEGARQVVAGVQRGGIVILICSTCGHLQSVGQKRHRTHD